MDLPLTNGQISDLVRPKCNHVWAVYDGERLLGCFGHKHQAERFRRREPWRIERMDWTFKQALRACNEADGTTPTAIGMMVANVQRGNNHVR